ncbi:MAG TPA: iron-regulated protein [Cyanobacteria bacterium UBA11149]|nr:iron-regulated protein [Cyanobacteria bacterium UBA11367]HBE58037.1 iron-regulated protein [Cyanobacteria bacterium UBA11366]HBK66258.1 iron-regulated protein [Cyanobacteria bacterium UBA11166]HBR75338.1 iron-regulated protein [Cyanobacteria bacterium UBA11159]HBS71947.1 iron-regulated protein [Cyanobacteria bacterium UBA11153]HBW90539.1 iron-regulated protein [Cyanobacteria bacterium UBA11149]HCA93928.1 iron-regulated protein [Cyanobacteria bacterium UBA9226]
MKSSKYYSQHSNAFDIAYLHNLRGAILSCPYLTINNLNRDFIGTKGFSVVFKRSKIEKVEQKFSFFKPYLDLALLSNCNAFYLNPLLLQSGSRVEPHIDRSLRSYCKTVEPPLVVSVLYVQLPPNLEGGELVLCRHKQQVGQIKPEVNTLLYFQGDLTHSVNMVKTTGTRLSLVCEQYNLSESELQDIPEFTIESRAVKAKRR